jgi:hypothetical protein
LTPSSKAPEEASAQPHSTQLEAALRAKGIAYCEEFLAHYAALHGQLLYDVPGIGCAEPVEPLILE